jgi:hypothetical protein
MGYYIECGTCAWWNEGGPLCQGSYEEPHCNLKRCDYRQKELMVSPEEAERLTNAKLQVS